MTAFPQFEPMNSLIIHILVVDKLSLYKQYKHVISIKCHLTFFCRLFDKELIQIPEFYSFVKEIENKDVTVD